MKKVAKCHIGVARAGSQQCSCVASVQHGFTGATERRLGRIANREDNVMINKRRQLNDLFMAEAAVWRQVRQYVDSPFRIQHYSRRF